MNIGILFNCCTGLKEPSWSEFVQLEIGACTTHLGNTVGGKSWSEADFFTVYGRRASGDCEAITDIDATNYPAHAPCTGKNFKLLILGYAISVATELGERSKLPVMLYRLGG